MKHRSSSCPQLLSTLVKRHLRMFGRLTLYWSRVDLATAEFMLHVWRPASGFPCIGKPPNSQGLRMHACLSCLPRR